jgi:hypothetical protein
MWLSIVLVLASVQAQNGPPGSNPVPSAKGSQNMPTQDAAQPMPTLAIRLIFEYEGDDVRLISQQPVDMVVTGFDITQTQRPGYYVEARNSAGQTLARVPARNAMAGSAEVFPESPGQPISRVDVPKPRGAFTVVVPAPDGADHVSFVRVTPVSAQAQVSAAVAGPVTTEVTEIAQFPLRTSR